MPTENEIKIVIRQDCESFIANQAVRIFSVSQGYLLANRGTSLRLRKLQDGRVIFTPLNQARFKQSQRALKHFMTFKCSTNGGANRVVEIEKKIDQRDFNDLWPQCMNKLIKLRYILRDSHRQFWEIDFFKTHDNKNYFALAELEMPEGQVKPKYIPPFITKCLLHMVPLTDCRFSSKLLADVRYATELYKTLGERNERIV